MPSTSFSRSGDVDSRDSIRCQPFASSTASWVLSVRGHAKWGRATTGHSSRQGTCWRRSHASRTPATTVQSLSPVNSIDKPTRGSRTTRHDANAQVTVTAASIVSILESNAEPHQLARRANSADRDHGSVRGRQLPPSSSHRTKAERRSEAFFRFLLARGPRRALAFVLWRAFLRLPGARCRSPKHKLPPILHQRLSEGRLAAPPLQNT